MFIVALFLFVSTAAGQTVPSVDYQQCSFPFTLNGTVYYSCIQNIPNVTNYNDQLGCYLANRTGAICLNQPTGYSCPVNPVTFTLNGINYASMNICGWILIMNKQNSTAFSWTQNWAAYANGFGSPDQDFWLGNEPVYQLTNASGEKYRLRIELLRNGNYKWYAVEYWQFGLSNNATNYVLTANGFAGGDTFTDGFNALYLPASNKQNGMPFSTQDVDNDSNPNTSCSVYNNGVGWWYNSCYFSCLTANTAYITANVWPYNQNNNPNYRYVIRGARMMIQKVA